MSKKGDKSKKFEDESGEEDFHIQPGKTSPLSIVLGVACFPFTLCCSVFTVQENEEVVTLNYGKYTGVVQDPGVHWANCWGRELVVISKAKLTVDLPNTKVIDKNGNPVMVSGVVFYHFRDTRRAALDIEDRFTFVKDIATAVMKQIVSQYPYENGEDSDGESDNEEKTPCLKRDAEDISNALVKALQKQVSVAGAYIDSFRFNEISYAPEIAAGMLKKQQAQAIVAARETLVEGAVKIATGVVGRLEKKNVNLPSEEKARLISNLLAVVCADEAVHPVLSLNN
eukprot:TRINITY_DN11973_c0_g1_i1.p2 TRINITY_DN11973_c0_g1~~TRINITY_DN11973_c0_g1_i1.p2  ORF type:complete len:284 (+),score=53.89 TRINITY_DN11973_c0_g1_i1:937-1788(+)